MRIPYQKGFFKGSKLTKQDMVSIADFNKVVLNYLKIKKLLKETEKDKRWKAWIKNIANGVTDKKSIANNVNDKVRLNGTAHFIRRHLLHNGICDNINQPYTEYYVEGQPQTIKRDLFSQ